MRRASGIKAGATVPRTARRPPPPDVHWSRQRLSEPEVRRPVSHPSGRFPSTLRLGLILSAVTIASAMAQQPLGQPQQPSTPAAAQPAASQDPPQPPPRFKAEANFVRVDVYPTRGGVPVQDLRLDEFEVLENGQRQTIQAFEHVVISPAGPQSLRTEASSVRQGEEMAANP